ncbi:hypothetical protein M413DRAFT_437960 [Hebeloma cylindrosporum]|uniref:Uncharacterized protein n=1 Tax=Hebeloma cylindrosporum TaxID=76867 RepID=A0A0C3CJA4_HEBCY|nr:hypothetical protein M413DRAFT_437960 [Hebeloma cylindrosporum h7]
MPFVKEFQVKASITGNVWEGGLEMPAAGYGKSLDKEPFYSTTYFFLFHTKQDQGGTPLCLPRVGLPINSVLAFS